MTDIYKRLVALQAEAERNSAHLDSLAEKVDKTKLDREAAEYIEALKQAVAILSQTLITAVEFGTESTSEDDSENGGGDTSAEDST